MSETNRKLKECTANCHFYFFDKAVKSGTVLYFSEPYDCGGTTKYERFYERMVFAEDLSKMGTVPSAVFSEIEPFLSFL